jgi:hypothetical protein
MIVDGFDIESAKFYDVNCLQWQREMLRIKATPKDPRSRSLCSLFGRGINPIVRAQTIQMKWGNALNAQSQMAKHSSNWAATKIGEMKRRIMGRETLSNQSYKKVSQDSPRNRQFQTKVLQYHRKI